MRKLVQKYRLELSNREGNFNRMFTDKAPVHVDHRSLKSLAPLPGRAPARDKSLTLSQPSAGPTVGVGPSVGDVAHNGDSKASRSASSEERPLTTLIFCTIA